MTWIANHPILFTLLCLLVLLIGFALFLVVEYRKVFSPKILDQMTETQQKVKVQYKMIQKPSKELQKQYRTTSETFTNNIQFGMSKVFPNGKYSIKNNQMLLMEWTRRIGAYNNAVYALKKAIKREEKVKKIIEKDTKNAR